MVNKTILVTLMVLVVFSVSVVGESDMQSYSSESTYEIHVDTDSGLIFTDEVRYAFIYNKWHYYAASNWHNLDEMGWGYVDEQKNIAKLLENYQTSEEKGYNYLITGVKNSFTSYTVTVVKKPEDVITNEEKIKKKATAAKATQSSAATINPSQPSATQQQIITTPGCNTPQCQEADYIWSQIAGFVKPEYRGKVWNVVIGWSGGGNNDALPKITSSITSPGILGPPTSSIRLTSCWGVRQIDLDGDGVKEKDCHDGMDFDGNTGDHIFSIAEGIVFKTGNSRGYGKFIIIKHNLNDLGEFYSRYNHLSNTFVVQGNQISKGQQIGEMGNSGLSVSGNSNIEPSNKGSHLHLTIYQTADHGVDMGVNPQCLYNKINNLALITGGRDCAFTPKGVCDNSNNNHKSAIQYCSEILK
jgi:murein DD-endopeptidase MepM/ murein hydrolase activator NlpD